MKRFFSVTAVVMLLVVLVMGSCEKEEKQEKQENDKLVKENIQIVSDTFPEYKETIVKDYVYKALDEAKKGTTCDSNINEKINNYLISLQIDASECDHKDILTYYNYLIKNKSDDAYKFLMKNKYISEEAYNVMSEIENNLEKSGEMDIKLYDYYIKDVSKNNNLSKSEQNKIILGLQITKYSMQYFDENTSKGACGRCIRHNSAFIFGAGTGGGALIGTLGCLPLVNPVAIVACITVTAGITTVWFICDSCKPVCWYCL